MKKKKEVKAFISTLDATQKKMFCIVEPIVEADKDTLTMLMLDSSDATEIIYSFIDTLAGVQNPMWDYLYTPKLKVVFGESRTALFSKAGKKAKDDRKKGGKVFSYVASDFKNGELYPKIIKHLYRALFNTPVVISYTSVRDGHSRPILASRIEDTDLIPSKEVITKRLNEEKDGGYFWIMDEDDKQMKKLFLRGVSSIDPYCTFTPQNN